MVLVTTLAKHDNSVKNYPDVTASSKSIMYGLKDKRGLFFVLA